MIGVLGHPLTAESGNGKWGNLSKVTATCHTQQHRLRNMLSQARRKLHLQSCTLDSPLVLYSRNVPVFQALLRLYCMSDVFPLLMRYWFIVFDFIQAFLYNPQCKHTFLIKYECICFNSPFRFFPTHPPLFQPLLLHHLSVPQAFPATRPSCPPHTHTLLCAHCWKFRGI